MPAQERRTLRYAYGFDDVALVPGDVTINPDQTDIGFDLGDLRYTTGLAATWLSPVGVLTVSYGVPLNEEEGDRIEEFQFTFGTSF